MVHLAEQRSEGYETMIERWEQLGRSEFQEANVEAKMFNCIIFRVFPGQTMGMGYLGEFLKYTFLFEGKHGQRTPCTQGDAAEFDSDALIRHLAAFVVVIGGV